MRILKAVLILLLFSLNAVIGVCSYILYQKLKR